MIHHRFIAVIKDPGRIWTDYQVVDTDKFICMATCSQQRDAETIAAVLNLQIQKVESEKLLTQPQDP